MNQETTRSVKFETIDCNDLVEKHPSALMDLFRSEKDGFLIKKFLSQGELSDILKSFDKMDKKELAHTSVGYTYPMIFAEFSLRNAELTKEELLTKTEQYFRNNEHYNEEFRSDFGFDIKLKLDTMFANISGGRKIEVPDGLEGAGKYPFGNFRYLQPGGGGMAIHCGNYFQDRFRLFYSHLTETAKVVDQMSYFVMIQEPDNGGALEVFNMFWEDGQTKTDNLENRELILSDGSKCFPDKESIGKQSLRPEPGDMILFQGGSIWHRISQIEGTRPRITFGGFIAPNLDETGFYYWS